MIIVYKSYCLNCARFIHEEEDSHVTTFSGHAIVNYGIDSDYYTVVENESGFKIGTPISGTSTVSVSGFNSIEEALNFMVASGISALNPYLETPTAGIPGFSTLEQAILQNQSDIGSVSGSLQSQVINNDNDISQLQSAVTNSSGTLQSQISSNDSDITTLQGDVSTNATNISTASGTLQSSINGKVSLTGDELVQGIKTFDDDVVFRGNLVVSGSQTVINTTELTVEDALVTIASNQTGTPTLDAGLEVERGSSTNASFIWDETLDKWKAGLQGSEDLVVLEASLLASSGTLQTNINNRVLKAGDTMTGLLTLSADPSTALQAATKQYVDTRVLKTGDTMTGALVLPGNPSTTNQASNKGYVDTQDALKVAKAGDTMTGFLTLNANPTANLHAVPKQFLDSAVNNLQVQINAVSSAIDYKEAYATTSTSTTSSTYVTIDSMSITPTSGTHYVNFAGGMELSNANSEASYALYRGSTLESERVFKPKSNGRFAVNVQKVITVNGSEAITVQYKISASTLTVYTRDLASIKVSN